MNVQKNTMEVLRGQEANLESSKVFYKGSKSLITDVSTHAPKAMKFIEIYKIHENQ